MKHIIYQITNMVNNKIYIGKHSTNNLDDGYLGSGTLIKKAILKYGKHNFAREILGEFDTYQDAFIREAELVDQKFIDNPDTYNIILGGQGGGGLPGDKNPMYGKTGSMSPLYGKLHSEEWRSNQSKSWTDERKAKQSRERTGILNHRYGKNFVLSPETKTKMSMSTSGAKNPCFGKTGVDHPAFGKKRTKAQRLEMSIRAKNIPKIECPHCGTKTAPHVSKRWHFDNCKSK